MKDLKESSFLIVTLSICLFFKMESFAIDSKIGLFKKKDPYICLTSACEKVNPPKFKNKFSPIETQYSLRSSSNKDDAKEGQPRFGFTEYDSINLDVSIRENRQYLIYEVKVNDLKKESIKVEVRNGLAIVTANTKIKTYRVPSQDYFLKFNPFFDSVYKRKFRIPEDVDSKNIQADFKNGILIIKFRKLAK